MTDPDCAAELDVLVRSRYGIIVLDTPDEAQADALIRAVATRQSLSLWQWSRHAGLRRAGTSRSTIPETSLPLAALQHIAGEGAEGLYIFPVHEPWLDEPGIASALLETGAALGRVRGAVILVGDSVRLPAGLAREAATIPLPAPSESDYRDLLRRLVRDLQPKMELTPDETARLLRTMQGLTQAEARRVLTRAMLDDGRLEAGDLELVATAKRQSVLQESLLEYYAAEETLADVAGLGRLKSWLAARRALLADPAKAAQYRLPFPRGILLLGVPGCGKSLSAKAVAREWELPLVKLDASRLYNKYVGETERNLRRAMRAAERVSPAVLWIDEIEKAFAIDGGSDDGGLSLRLLGAFLSWLQERRHPVFVVATANDIARLPPELIRKGRFDEVFFVDLPGPTEREAIFALQLRQRGQDHTRFDLTGLAAATEGWSGAEIEQAVVGALYTCLAGNTPLDNVAILWEIDRTRPLSDTMREKVLALRGWAEGRAVPAS
jgi:ATPase family associated with various cellular activities (AAA)